MKNDDKFRRQSDGRLPRSRKELFGYILKWRFTHLLAVGLLLLVFMLPFLALLTYYDIYASVISQSGNDVSDKIVTLKLQTSLLEIIACMVLFFGLGGIFYLLRQLSWGEPTSVLAGWWHGAKQNGKRFVLIGVCVGVLNAINVFAEVLLHGFVRYIPSALFVVFVLPVLLYVVVLDVVYDKKTGNLLSSAVTMYCKTVPITLLFAVLVTVPKFLLLVPKFTIRYAILSVWIVAVMPVLLCGWTFYAMHNFDKFINSRHYPEIYNKGIYPEDTGENNITEN